jgi:hypothetical protein
MQTITPPRTVEQKLETAQMFGSLFEQMLARDSGNEDLQALITIARAYTNDLQRVIDRRKLTESEYYTTRNAKLLAEVIIHELHETEDLSGWYFGIEPGDSMLFAVANLVTDAHLQFVEAMMKGRRRDYQPLSDEDFAAIERLLG